MADGKAVCGGADPCATSTCATDLPGSQCDPTDGVCKCGGATCSTGQVCLQQHGVSICSDGCAALGDACPEGAACSYDSGSHLGVCIATGTAKAGEACTESSDCEAGSLCALSSDGRKCRELCDPGAADRGEPSGCPPAKHDFN
jgi:hypothetical protein